jgi:YD repeat-containing protein
MKKYILFIVVIFTLISCDITKQAFKDKSNSDLKISSETRIFRKGDTVHYNVPIIHYRDTTITTVNRQGTVLKTIYDNNGKVTSIDCYASQIEQLTRENSELKLNNKEKQKEKTEKADYGWMLYVFGAISIVLSVALFLLFKYVRSHSDLLTEITRKIT